MSRTRRHVGASLIGIGLLLGLSAVAVGEDASKSELPLDPLVSEVVEMLSAGVSNSLIVQWLESTGRRPEDIGSRGVIALNDAGASEQLVETLLELVEEWRDKELVAEPLPAPERHQVGTAVTPPPQEDSRAATGSGVESLVRLSAKRVWVDEDEPDSPREPRWDVFLYLDGEFVAWTRPDREGDSVEAHRLILPGRRELRIVLQRYEERRRGWSYESLSVPTLVAFEAHSEDPIEIEVEMKRIWGLWRDRKDGGPLSYVIRQGSEVLAEIKGTGGNPDSWQPVCEDVEANFPEAQGVPGAFRSSMNRCLRWVDLWTGAGKSTSRTEILEELAEHHFEPPVL